MKTTIITLLLLFIVKIGLSQFMIDAEIRPRAEIRHGYKLLLQPGLVASNFISQRTRINFNIHIQVSLSVSACRIPGYGEMNN